MFQKRKLNDLESLSGRLKYRREKTGLSQDQLARQLQIGQKYVVALETAAWEQLPSQMLAEQYLRKLVRFYGVEEELYLQDLRQVWEEWRLRQATVGLAWWQRGRWAWTKNLFGRLKKVNDRSVVTVAVGLAIAVVVGYLTWGLVRIIRPPEIEIYSPAALTIFPVGAEFDITGKTEPGVQLSIDGETVPVDPTGEFFFKKRALLGRDSFVIIAERTNGRSREVVREIIVEAVSE